MPPRPRFWWWLLALLVLAQIGYPLSHGTARAALVIGAVLVGFGLSVGHAAATRGARTVLTLLVVTTLGGLAVEALGVASGVPFGRYAYTGALGPRLLGVPLIIPLAWTWLAWPAWLAAARLVGPVAARVPLAGLGLAGWDLFLDPQMVAAGYWHWARPRPALPGVPDVPLSNYLAWLAVAVLMMAALAGLGRPGGPVPADRPAWALYLWTYYSSVLAHAVFLGLPASAAWGAAGMGLVSVPLSYALLRRWLAGRQPRRQATRSGRPGRTGPR